MPKTLLSERRRPAHAIHRIAAPVPTVPQEYVHLHKSDSVLLTNWSSLGSDRYTVSAKWPLGGVYGGSVPLLITQTIRQSCLLIGHAELGVPLSHQTLMEWMDFNVSEDFYHPRNKQDALFILLTCKFNNPRSARVELSILSEGRLVAESLLDFSWIAPGVYRRLRGAHGVVAWGESTSPAPVPAHTVGRAGDHEVVLAPSGLPNRWELRTDVTNQALYDHPVDHVPGLVLIEAAYQATHAVTGPGRPPVRVMSTFDRYVEFDAPCWIDAAVVPAPEEGVVRVEVTGVQNGDRTFSIRMDCAG
ncbi:ScbA/BarX family gamma-butyrolactone biosynthesis protein [Streptomyces sp. NBC_00059]|uniref:ScbA/BarX family gamma-butyrolactone biosynthesis protein n=1 Tax=Streptomyces sp. NBC_00059 TaxID=2975635 RepID=UPI0022508CC1|nr:ScbA/BarX family gamma-butyrolactone biosynthesis protein [Streptomyces sp. NBC_00059]MCX5417794.1 ScbA/BarX family gamma-butyrolactone biosynthesis protein [Streptomyces sp. NBC_00059]